MSFSEAQIVYSQWNFTTSLFNNSGGNTQVLIEKLTSKLHFKGHLSLIHLLELTILVWLDSNLFYSQVLPVQLREVSLIIFFYQLVLLSLNTVIYFPCQWPLPLCHLSHYAIDWMLWKCNCNVLDPLWWRSCLWHD